MNARLVFRLRVALLIALATLCVSACESGTPKLTSKEQQHMTKLTEKMIPRCLGRYLLDLPADMKLGANYETIIDNEVHIEVEPMTKTSFGLRLEQREAQLKAGHLLGKPNQPTLKEIISLDGTFGQIFNRSEDDGSNVPRTLELHAWRDGYAIKMWVNATDMSYAEEERRNKPNALQTDTREQPARLFELFSRLRGRAEAEVPTDPGVCFANGFIRGSIGEREDVSINFAMSSMPDVYLHVEIDSGITEDNTLLDRSREIDASLEAADGRTVRKGKRKTNGISFEEWLTVGNTNELTEDRTPIKGHLFTLEGNSKTGSVKTPLFIIELHNGERESEPGDPILYPNRPPRANLKQASLSEAEAVALWDAITNTLRPRPGAL